MNLVEQLAKASAGSPPKRVLGIDLGTTNSTVAQVQLPLDPAGSPELLCECSSVEQMTWEKELPEGSVVKEFLTTAADGKNYQTREATVKDFLIVQKEGPRNVTRSLESSRKASGSIGQYVQAMHILPPMDFSACAKRPDSVKLGMV